MSITSRRGIFRLGCATILQSRYRLFGQRGPEYSARAIRLLEENPVVDLLNQFRFPDFAEKPPKIDHWLEHPKAFRHPTPRPICSPVSMCFRWATARAITNRV